ncbi:hypothetical protein AB0F17_19470 [Nonomuraea sp. NPDC026600]|uniref:hypothetical protein n=1 Tax=Nonomuraea sp. NPDC026600 TaxID=3155363 RepID=UPI0033CB9D01
MTPTVVRIALGAALLVLVILYPFLPGEYDPVAMPLSLLAQVLGLAGLILLPVAIAWVIQEARGRRSRLAVVSLALASLVAIIVATFAVLVAGWALGLATLGLWGLLAAHWVRQVRQPSRGFSPVPVYLVVAPLVSLAAQVTLAGPVTDMSRDQAIRAAAPLIADIERHRAQYGGYPESLEAVNRDYGTSVTGAEKYFYARRGASYNLFFRQPRFFADDFGVREIVIYNPREDYMMPNHVNWILLWSEAELRSRPGWFTSRDLAPLHWKSLWFD